MRNSYIIILFLLIVLLITPAELSAQPGFLKRLFKKEPPPEEEQVQVIDTAEVLIEDEFELRQVGDSLYYPEQEQYADEGDTLQDVNFDHLPDSIAAVLDTMKLDSLVRNLLQNSDYWISIDSFFVVFDSMTVNPYDYDAVDYKDSLAISLCDSLSLNDTLPEAEFRGWSMPIDHCHVTSKFGSRWYRWHYGTDLRVAIGDSVYAAFDGVVRISKNNPGGYGQYIMLRHHNGFETLYGHLSKRIVGVGEEVKAGQCIGLGGNTGRSTGPHLHYEVRYRGNAIDPERMYDFKQDTLQSLVYELTPEDFDYIREMRKAVYHRIRSGDTLSGIARKYRVSVRHICRLNGISPRTILRIGRVLRVR